MAHAGHRPDHLGWPLLHAWFRSYLAFSVDHIEEDKIKEEEEEEKKRKEKKKDDRKYTKDKGEKKLKGQATKAGEIYIDQQPVLSYICMCVDWKTYVCSLCNGKNT